VRWANTVRVRTIPTFYASIVSIDVGSQSSEKSDNESRSELDSHADCCVFGTETVLEIMDYGRPARVSGFDKSASRARTCRTISGAVAYDEPITGVTWMLLFHQGVLVPSMKHNLLCPAQMRDVGIRVNDEPKHTVLNPTNQHHAITVYGEGGKVKLCIPMSLKGINAYFPSRVPSKEEFDRHPADRVIDMTDEHREWKPKDDRLQQNEQAMTDGNGNVPGDQGDENIDRMMSAVLCDLPGSASKHPEYAFAEALESTVRISGVNTDRDKGKLRPENLVQRWGVSLEKATRTLEATTHRLVRSTLHPHLSRRYGTNDRGVRYNRISEEIFTDTLKAQGKSWFRKNEYAQVFASRKGFCRCYPMRTKGQAHEALSLFASREGVPPNFVMDGAKEQVQGEFRKKMRQMQAGMKQIEPHSPWQNEAEATIREIKRGADRKMTKAKSPKCLWDHCLELECLIRSATWRSSLENEGQVPHSIVLGQECDISSIAELCWYEWVRFYDTTARFPEPKEVYGRWLGPSPDVGPVMCAKILKKNGQVVPLSTYRPITDDEMKDPSHQKEREEFDKAIEAKLGQVEDDASPIFEGEEDHTPEQQLYADDFEGTNEHVPDIDDVTPEEYDSYVGAEVNLPYDGEMKHARVRRRTRNIDGEVCGKANDNPLLDTRMYEVEFEDGRLKTYTANLIAENMFARSDANGQVTMLFDGIIDHQVDKSKAVAKEDAFFEKNNRKYRRKTTAGWKLCVQWKDGSTSWLPLSDVKESYPVEVAEYAVASQIDDEPAFRWWIPYVLEHRERVIKAVKSRYQRTTHKYGIEVPKTVKRALEIDKENGNTLWADALAKEMSIVGIAFKVLENGELDVPPGYQYMQCHMVYDIKLDGFRRKCRLVAGGHMIETPPHVTYAGVVSRDTVRIAFMMAALHDLEVKACDIENAYLTAPANEKVWTLMGPEFGAELHGKAALIVRALYGLPAAGAAFRNHLADCMRHLGYTPSKADPDLWMKEEVRPDDGFKYWSYILLYVDDALCINHNAESELYKLDKYFKMKKGSIGDPDIYLGAKMSKVTLSNGVEAWSASPSKYVQESVKNTEEWCKKHRSHGLPKKCRAPWPTNYHSEICESPALNETDAHYFQTQIGVLQWVNELGRIDISTEVSKLSSCLALPREGHLEAMFQVYGYLKAHHNARLVFDPTYPLIRMSDFNTNRDWTEFYKDAKEDIPDNAPEPRGRSPDIVYFGDADHAGDRKTRRSRTGYIIFLNNAPIIWFSKRQTTVETSVFGSEFVAMKQGMERLTALRYKLRMMGIPITDPAFMYGDNLAVIYNTSRPESTLKKKSNSVAYHYCRERVAMGMCLTSHVISSENCSDICTKCVPAGERRRYLVSKVLHDIYDYDEK